MYISIFFKSNSYTQHETLTPNPEISHMLFWASQAHHHPKCLSLLHHHGVEKLKVKPFISSGASVLVFPCSYNAEKVFDKIQHPFLMKALNRNWWIFLTWENVYLNPNVSVLFSGNILETCLLRTRIRQGCPLFLLILY